MTKKYAFSYIRMSTEAQLKGHSLERQLDLTRSYAAEHGLTLVDDIRDIGLSAHDGSHVEKGKLGEFLDAVKAGKIGKGTALLVENLDRLSRQTPLQALEQLIGLVRYGIEIHTIFDRQVFTQESLNSNPGQLFTSVGYMIKAHSESADKSKRLQRRWQSNRDNIRERNLTSICPAWLSPNPSKKGYSIVKEKGDTVRKIFDLCIDESMGALSIAAYLDANQVPPLSDQRRRKSFRLNREPLSWHKSYVLKILNNPAVFGQFMPHKMIDGKREPTGEIIEDYFPSVISRDRYMLAQARIRQRKQQGGGRKGVGFQNLFTKLIVCGECGSNVSFYDKGPGPKGGKYLRCSKSAARQGCNCRGWRYDEFEQAFFGYVSDINFASALTRGNHKSRRDILIQEREIIEERNVQYAELLDGLLDLQGGMSLEAIRPIRQKIERIVQDQKDLDVRKNQIETELADLNKRTASNLQQDILETIKKADAEASETERGNLRRLIHGQITMAVSRIDFDGLRPDDDLDVKCFTVVFKGGPEQTVFPYSTDDEEFAEIRPIDGMGERVQVSTTSFKFLGKLDPASSAKAAGKKRKAAAG